MDSSPIKFGTSGWRGVIAEDFTYANVRLAVRAIAEHAMHDRGIRSNPRPIRGPADIMEILELARA